MIFHFDLTAAEIAATSTVMLEGCISEAVRAHRLGQHLIIINRDAADYLAAHVDLNSIERATLSKLRADYTQTAMLTRKASTYIRIAALPSGTIRRIGNAIELSVDQAVLTALYERTVLLVEDENTDGPLFEFLLENLRAKTVGMVPLSFQPFHGGGERIVDVARKRVNERRLVCVIVDTDKFSPVGSPSDKVHKLNRIAYEESWPLIFVQPDSLQRNRKPDSNRGRRDA